MDGKPPLLDMDITITHQDWVAFSWWHWCNFCSDLQHFVKVAVHRGRGIGWIRGRSRGRMGRRMEGGTHS